MGHHPCRWLIHSVTRFLVAGALSIVWALPPFPVFAAASLTVTPITWNVVGLDSNDVNVGPNNFPVGARVCNTGDAAATNVESHFVWDTTDTYINLRPGSLFEFTVLNGHALSSLPAGACYDFYYEVQITRNSSAYNHAARYHITATATTLGTVSTPTPREVFVEHLISQNRNSTNDVKFDGTSVAAGGTMSLQVGNTYVIELDASTATQGYNQLEDFINFPNTVFQVLSVESHYSANSSGFVANPSDKLYADGCLWDNNPTSPAYRSCIGSDGKTGGTIRTIYTVKIIGGAGTSRTLNTLIYDFSGSSYHYNADFSTQARIASISSPLTMTKSFSPVSISGGDPSELSIAIINSSSSAVTGLSLTDTLPTSPAQMSVDDPLVASVSAGCLSPVFSPIVGATSFTYTGGVAASSTCTIKVNVTAPANGTYVNTTGHLFVNSVDTGTTATANLTVAPTSSGGGLCGLTLAQWTMGTGAGTVPPGYSFKAGDVATAQTTSSGLDSSAIDTSNGNPPNSWQVSGFNQATANADTSPYVQFQVDTSQYAGVQLTLDFRRAADWSSADNRIVIYSSTTGAAASFTEIGRTLIAESWPVSPATSGTYSASTTGTSSTYFRITAIQANNRNALLYLDNVRVTGCGTAQKPTITKVFNAATIAAGGTSTLTFALTNPNSAPLTLATFSDTLPSGVQVASTPAASSTCAGYAFNPSAGATTLTFSGGTIPAGGSCTAQVNVTAASAGVYHNTSGFISSYESGTNTGAGGSASATLTVLAPPAISKAFSPNPIYAGNTSTLTFTITNPNSGTALTGVAFTDDLPVDLTIPTAPTAAQCGGTVSRSLIGGQYRTVTLTGGSIAAGGTCTATVATTSSITGSYANTSGSVSSTNAGTGNTASDTLGVQAVHPGIAILKQVSTSASGPWASAVNVAPGGSVYYRLTIENIGDVPLSPVSATDPTLDITGCAWPATLPVGTSIIDPTATCVVGPISASTEIGTYSNTATGHGTYSGTEYDSAESTASYATTALTLVKSITETSFSAAGNVLHYNYVVSNTGTASLALPATVIDSNTMVICPATAGGDSNLDPGESVACTSTYSVTAFDMSVGSITNTAYATVSSIRSNTDRETIYRNLPDLVVSKTDNTNGHATTGSAFSWTVTVANQGPVDAVFTAGQTILRDQLPSSGAAYGSATLGASSGIAGSGTISCSIDPGTKLLTCIALGDSVTIGATTGSFAINVQVTPSATGSLVNTASVDPNGNVAEGNEGNNNGSDAVTVIAAVAPTVTKAFGASDLVSGGNTSLTVTIGNTNVSAITLTSVLTDTLPTGMTIKTTGNTGTCTGVTATAGAGSFTMAGGTSIPAAGCTIIVDVTSSTAGVVVNTIAAGALQTSAGNNASEATDTLNVYVPPTVTKAFGASTILSGGSTTLTLTLGNPGGNPGALTTVQVDDTLPTGLTLQNTTFTFTPGACGTVTNISGAASAAGDDNVRFGVASIAAGSSCQVVLNVTSSTTGAITNTTSVPTATGPVALTGTAASADLTISSSSAPTVTKAFGASDLASGGNTSLTVTIGSTNASAITLMSALTDTLPTGMTIGTAGNAGTCTGVTATAGAGSFTMASGTSIASDGCTIIVNITSSTAGAGANTIAAGALQTSAGNNASAATDTLNVYIPPTVTKSFTPASIASGGTSSMQIIVTNPAGNPGNLTGVSIGDTYAGTLVNNAAGSVSCSSGSSATLTGGVNGGTAVGFTAGSIEPGDTCTITQSVTATSTNSNTTSVPTASGPVALTGTAANATLTVINPSMTVEKTIGTVNFNSTTVINLGYSITVKNTGDAGLSAVQVVDDLTVAFPPPATYTLPGSAVGTSCPSTSSFAPNSSYDGKPSPGGDPNLLDPAVSSTLAAGDTCTISILVQVTTGAAGMNYTNTADAIGTPPAGPPVTASGSVAGPTSIDPALTKSADPAQAEVGSTVTFTITVTNNGTAAATGVVVTDTLTDNLDYVSSQSIDANSSLPRGTITVTAPRTITVDIGALGIADRIVITIVTTVNSLGTPPVENSARLTAADPPEGVGPDPTGNNTSTATLGVSPEEPGGSKKGGGDRATPGRLPSTGFAAGANTILPSMPADRVYSAQDDVSLEIPSLRLRMPIVGVPFSNDTWDVTWLSAQAGWLQGTAFPSWSGNSLLTAHVYLSNGLPGPFVNLHKLHWGDQIIVHLSGQRYVYEVRAVKVVSPDDTSVFQHRDDPWLTLITCKDYASATNTYAHRVVVTAVLVKTETESTTNARAAGR